MNTNSAALRKNGRVLLIDFLLLAALFLLPSLSHLLAVPLYKLEPMRVALLVALLFTHRANAYFVALALPLASAWITGHPEPVKAVLMGLELTLLVAAYGFLARRERVPTFAALLAAIAFSKAVYYSLKYLALGAGLLGGSLVSTPLTTQLILAVGTALVFSAVETRLQKARR